MKEVDLTDLAAKFAGEYVSERFKKGTEIEKHLILNSLAHGYFMGARWTEDRLTLKWYHRFIPVKIPSPSDLVAESIKAAAYYLKKKDMLKLEFAQQALIKATLCKGFQEGASWRVIRS